MSIKKVLALLAVLAVLAGLVIVPTGILADFGRNKANETALFTLQSKAGLSGFTVFYDKQDSAKCYPYAYTVRGSGCDNSVKGIYLTGCEGETVNLINSRLVCLDGTGRKSYIYADAKFRGTANVFNTTMWGTSTLGAEVSGGRVNLTQGVMVSSGGVGVLLNNGHVSVSGMLIGNCSDAVFYIEDSATAADSSYKAFGNLVGAGTLLKNRSGLIPQGSDLKK